MMRRQQCSAAVAGLMEGADAGLGVCFGGMVVGCFKRARSKSIDRPVIARSFYFLEEGRSPATYRHGCLCFCWGERSC
jgi:hypothetical protein